MFIFSKLYVCESIAPLILLFFSFNLLLHPPFRPSTHRGPLAGLDLLLVLGPFARGLRGARHRNLDVDGLAGAHLELLAQQAVQVQLGRLCAGRRWSESERDGDEVVLHTHVYIHKSIQAFIDRHVCKCVHMPT